MSIAYEQDALEMHQKSEKLGNNMAAEKFGIDGLLPMFFKANKLNNNHANGLPNAGTDEVIDIDENDKKKLI